MLASPLRNRYIIAIMHDNVITAQPDLHNIPVFYPHGTRLIWINTDGEVFQLDRQAVAAELALGLVLLCHSHWSKARAGVEIHYLDIMEFRFCKTRKICFANANRIGPALGLARQIRQDMASLLPNRLFTVDELDAQPVKDQTEAARIADMMTAGGWAWGPLFWRILGCPSQPHQMDGKRQFGTGCRLTVTPRTKPGIFILPDTARNG